MSSVRVYVYWDADENGSMAHVPALPGANATRPDRDEAVERALVVLRDEIEFLRARGLPLPDLDLNEVVVADPLAENVFLEDFAPLAAEEIPALLERMALSRERLLEQVAGLAPDEPGREPDGGWSIAQILEHVANAEQWYIDRLYPMPTEPLAAAAATRRLLAERLVALDETGRAQVAVHYGMEWTARKVLRRALEVERAWGEYIGAILGGDAGVPVPPGHWSGNETRPEDSLPLTADERDSGLAELARLGGELAEGLAGRSPEVLEQVQAADGCSATEALKRLAYAHWFLRSRLQNWPSDVFDRLAAIRAMAVERLAGLSEEERTRTTVALWGEQWTARKIFRRFLEHERQHYDHIREVLGLSS